MQNNFKNANRSVVSSWTFCFSFSADSGWCLRPHLRVKAELDPLQVISNPRV